jgi:penicillin amidase
MSLRYRWLPSAILLGFPLATAAQPAKIDAPDVLMARSKGALAQVDGELKLVGLEEPVEILRDRWGVPHIYARNTHDLFFAQGFVAAQDRLFQIDMWLRQARGEMAEAFGPEFVEADTFARLMKYRGDMDAEWSSYAPDTREIATAFTAGINAAIDQFGEKPPIEFQILGLKPKKWKPEDILGRMSGIYMSQNFRNEVQRARLIAAVGIDKARWIAPVDPPLKYMSALEMDELKAIDGRILAGYEAATRTLSFKPAKTESNNWVVSGNRSTSGKPLLASDPHRAIALPSLRYLVHLQAPGWNVIGSGEPALPGVAIGHNDRIAWGFTIVGVDQADIYVEEVKPAGPTEYRVGDRWEAMTLVRETIPVKGEKDRMVELRYTRHGPVIFQDGKRNRAYALKWVGHEAGGAAYLASLSVGRAHNRQTFLAAIERWKVPGLNFVYADVDGAIGWIAAARTPVRAKHSGLLPVPGNGYEWSNFLAVRDLPQRFDPEEGWLATANHNIVPDGYQHRVGHEFAAPYRYLRIRQTLASRQKWDLDGFRAIQHDEKSLPGLAITRLLRGIELQDETLQPFAKLLAEWDGRLTVDANAGPLYAIWLRTLQEAFYSLQAPKELVASATSLGGLPTMLAALEDSDPRWFGADARAARDKLLRETFAKAMERLKKLPASQQDRWGALHTVTFRHPLATLDTSVAKAFNVGPFERTGDVNTPNNTRHDEKFNQIHGATYRHLFDLADWDRAIATSAPGQSGQPGSSHYADLAPLWAKGEYFPLAFSRSKVESVKGNRLMLKP